MSRIQYLREQAARAERLAHGGFDPLTTERLKQAARDFRAQAEELAVRPSLAGELRNQLLSFRVFVG